MTSEKNSQAPLSFAIAKWWGYILATCYLLYGGVSIVLTLMDSNVAKDFDVIMQAFLFLMLGVLLITVAYAFRDLKSWGWYGLVAINLLSIGTLLTRLSDPSSLVLSLVCLGAVVLLIVPSTRRCVFGTN